MAKTLTKKVNAKTSLQRSRLLSTKMKTAIAKYLATGSRYNNGRFYGLRKPAELNTKTKYAKGVSMGADNKGFFVYTHRARSHSFATPGSIPVKDIKWIESTG